MSRRIAAILVLSACVIGFTVIAEDRVKTPDKSQHMYVLATRTTDGPAIFMQVGDQTFVVPKLIMKKGESNYEISAKDENIVVRRETKDGFKDIARSKQIAIPFQLVAQESSNLRNDSMRSNDRGPGSGDFFPQESTDRAARD